MDRAFGDLVVVLARENVSECRLAGPVRPHDGMDLAFRDGQIDAIQNLCVFIRDLRMQVFDLEHFKSSYH